MKLVELGAAQLIELGSPPGQVQSPVLDLFHVVNFLETPFAGIELEPGESISSRQKALAERLRTLSRLERRALVNKQGLKGLGYVDLIDEMASIADELNGLVLSDSAVLGKSFKKKLKKIGKKVVKVVKSPAFLSVVGVAANLIPGVGQVASAALLTTAGIMAKKQQEKKAKKEMKKAEQEAARQAAAQDEAALNAYYGQYHVDYLDPLGYTPVVWSKFTLEQKRTTIEKLADGTLQPYGAPAAPIPAPATPVAPVSQAARDEVAQAAALSIAMKNEYGSQVAGSGIDPNTLPPDIRAQAVALAPKMEQQIEAAGKENFLATAKKALGQAGALDSFFKGAGAELPGGMADVFSKFTDGDSLKAGFQDLKNSGAAVGEGNTVNGILDAGSRFPWEYVAVGAGGIAVVTGSIYVLTRG